MQRQLLAIHFVKFRDPRLYKMATSLKPAELQRMLAEQKAAYREQLLKHGDSPAGVCWNNKETQDLRFFRLMAQILASRPESDSPFSIHDFGCGTAALHQYLLNRGIDHAYTGTDLVDEMILFAKQKYPGARFLTGDFSGGEPLEEHDYVVVSGVLNYALQADRQAWQTYCFRLIRKLFQSARKALAFNFLTSYRDFDDIRLAYFDPREVFDLCQRELSRFIHVDCAYPLFEVTMTVFKANDLKAHYDRAIYGKYFKASGQ